MTPFLFSSCSFRFSESKAILQSSWDWYQKKYQKAAAGFLNAASEADVHGDHELKQYALYGLAATYLMQNEDAAALARMDQVASDAPDQIRYASLYNSGVIAYRNGDYVKSAAKFREALKIDGTKNDAKVNLEMALQQQSLKNTSTTETELIPASESRDNSETIENAVFETIRENDKKQWKNSKQADTTAATGDY